MSKLENTIYISYLGQAGSENGGEEAEEEGPDNNNK